ncbi:hypothetical protein J8273_3945 [Carpediemonas membranifera]|uniref:Uncharacterized protein n=1 Tax=Carpediemonas membranifera TaxID=201153 RepID=A0A8J6BYB2_9EUKA|nr:hypothetical protein J8273_3945 [Carpediemonas membranifera]|eukprot:KAG9394311.1 hypothetical protein J8273_3945 [Carpediemonas membranifera]
MRVDDVKSSLKVAFEAPHPRPGNHVAELNVTWLGRLEPIIEASDGATMPKMMCSNSRNTTTSRFPNIARLTPSGTPITVQDLEQAIQYLLSRSIEPKKLTMELTEPATRSRPDDLEKANATRAEMNAVLARRTPQLVRLCPELEALTAPSASLFTELREMGLAHLMDLPEMRAGLPLSDFTVESTVSENRALCQIVTRDGQIYFAKTFKLDTEHQRKLCDREAGILSRTSHSPAVPRLHFVLVDRAALTCTTARDDETRRRFAFHMFGGQLPQPGSVGVTLHDHHRVYADCEGSAHLPRLDDAGQMRQTVLDSAPAAAGAAAEFYVIPRRQQAYSRAEIRTLVEQNDILQTCRLVTLGRGAAVDVPCLLRVANQEEHMAHFGGECEMAPRQTVDLPDGVARQRTVTCPHCHRSATVSVNRRQVTCRGCSRTIDAGAL